MNDTTVKPHFHVTAAIITRGEKLLITRRPKGTHLGGFWEFPGGKQEKDESLEVCLKREIREELDLNVEVHECLLTVEHEYETKKITLHFFECSLLNGRLKTKEGQQAEWIDPKELKKYTFPPPDKKIIDMLTSP